MTLDQIIAKLRAGGFDPRQNGKGWESRCPEHQGSGHNLTLKEGDNGTPILFCHHKDEFGRATCTASGIMEALGGTLKDLFDTPVTGHHQGDGKSKGRSKGRIVATYDYRGCEGQLLFQTVRFEPKDFRQRRPDEKSKDGWAWNLDGIETTLYHLPELIDADHELPVFIVEGEKDVDRLRGLGLIATCNPMGAGRWQDRYAEHFHGRNVVILSDNDDVGRKHANQIARSLHGKAKLVKLINLPGLAEKGDVSDFLISRPLDALLKLVEDTTEWTPSSEGGFSGFIEVQESCFYYAAACGSRAD
jgi:putative DNA primase/helicase